MATCGDCAWRGRDVQILGDNEAEQFSASYCRRVSWGGVTVQINDTERARMTFGVVCHDSPACPAFAERNEGGTQ
jgi:hypothetical protein